MKTSISGKIIKPQFFLCLLLSLPAVQTHVINHVQVHDPHGFKKLLRILKSRNNQIIFDNVERLFLWALLNWMTGHTLLGVSDSIFGQNTKTGNFSKFSNVQNYIFLPPTCGHVPLVPLVGSIPDCWRCWRGSSRRCPRARTWPFRRSGGPGPPTSRQRSP